MPTWCCPSCGPLHRWDIEVDPPAFRMIHLCPACGSKLRLYTEEDATQAATHGAKACLHCKEKFVPVKSWQRFCKGDCHDDYWNGVRKKGRQ